MTGLELILLKFAFSSLAVLGVAVISLKILEWTRILDWFRNRAALKAADKHNIAFAIKTAEANNKVGYITGIFNQKDESVLAAQKYEADALSPELKRLHAGGKDVLIVS